VDTHVDLRVQAGDLNKQTEHSAGEAPLVHAAAAIAGQLSQPLKMPWIGERLRRCRPLVRIAALFDNEKVSRRCNLVSTSACCILIGNAVKP
jgi:glycyl-tRNA synthetase beta subunit